MSVLLNALEKLDHAIDRLESSIEQSSHAPNENMQVDMFAEKLDATIEKVENALSEA